MTAADAAAPAARRSYTADLVALFRAREFQRPAARRLVSDPWAGPFLEAAGSPFAASAYGGVPGAALDRWSRRWPARLAQTILLRHRLMDEHVAARLAGGRAAQVALLGAGWDARAYRLFDPTAQPRFFEVDHPAFSSLKERVVEQVVGPVGHARFCPVDFGREGLDVRLREAGLDPAQPTVFVWEGVTYYLTREACEETLRAVLRVAAPGSSLVCDVWMPPTLLGPLSAIQRFGARTVLRALFSEPFLFWFEPGGESPEAWLERLGFREARCTRPETLARRLGRRAALTWTTPAMALVEAEVGAPA